MPRASAASLAIVAAARGYEPAPATLSPAAAEVWNRVIRSKPVEWFGPETYPLLETYCSLVIEHRAILRATQISDDPALLDAAVERLAGWAKVLAAQRNSLGMLATKMRLSQQSKYGARQATEGKNRPQAVAKGGQPWER